MRCQATDEGTTLVQVLIVEDSKNMQVALTDLVKTLDRPARVVATGRETEAREWLHENRGQWNLITVDLLLEEGSGFNFLHRAKQEAAAGHVVVLSGYVSPAIKRKCLDLGADAVFMKTEVKEFADYLTSIWKPSGPEGDL
jgi:two-component system OmpR family response regulator